MFLTYKNVYDLQIKLKLVKAIATAPLEKVFYIEIFMQRFNLSKSKKTTIKKNIVEIFSQLQVAGIIKNDYRLIKKNRTRQHKLDWTFLDLSVLPF